MPNAIADHGLIGDMRSAALVGRDGSLDWLCWPRFDSPPLFLRTLDAGKGGFCAPEPVAGGPALQPLRRRYVPGTNVLETELDGGTGTLCITDLMPVRAVADPGDQGPDADAFGLVLRRLACTVGRVRCLVRVRPSFNWARTPHRAERRGDGVLLHAGPYRLHVSSPGSTVHTDGGDAVLGLDLPAGTSAALLLAWDRDALPGADPAQLDADTLAYWHAWSGRCTYQGRHRDMVLRSALALKLLTYAPTGGIIAAPTSSLPEWPGGVRNWDYRYVWLRDASFTVSAFLNLGYRREAAEFIAFLRRADNEGRALKVVYGVERPVPSEAELPHLAGHLGSRPVRTGNGAAKQLQHDIYGEFLLALGMYLQMQGQDGLCASVRAVLPDVVRNLAAAVCDKWRDPDQGVWELRGDPQHVFHTKALCWVALDRACRMAPLLGLGAEVPAWSSLRDRIRREYLRRGWSRSRGAYTMAYGSDALDAAVLRTALFGAIDPHDPRLQATVERIQAELAAPEDPDLVRRYDADDGLPGPEGAFVACGWWVAGVEALQGRTRQAAARMERLLLHANDLGLFAEELDSATGAQLGNFPQGFTHMAVINGLVRLQECVARLGEA